MPSLQPTGSTPRAGAVAIALCLYALVCGVLSFLAWPLDLPRLADWGNDGIAILPNAAIAVACAAASLLLLHFGRWRASAALGVIVGLLGVTTLFQHATGIDLPRLNQLFLFDRTWGQAGVATPGRMGPPGAICWTLMGVALVVAALPGMQRTRRIVPAIALFTGAIATISTTGYLLEARRFYSLPLRSRRSPWCASTRRCAGCSTPGRPASSRGARFRLWSSCRWHSAGCTLRASGRSCTTYARAGPSSSWR
jgi:hypothetical protein